MPRLNPPMLTTQQQQHTAAAATQRNRVTGTVVDTGIRSGRYRHHLLWVRTPAGLVPGHRLPDQSARHLEQGAQVDLEV